VSRAAFATLGVIGAALAGILALELRGIEGDAVTIGAASTAAARWRPAPEVPTPPPPDRTGDWAATALARPIFAPDRRPVAEPRAVAAAGGGELPRLTGVLIAPGGATAIFAGTGDNATPQVMRVGDRLGGFEVKAILAGEVTLAGPDGHHVLRPSFDPSPAPAPRAAPAPSAPMPRPPSSGAATPGAFAPGASSR
jgi:general secretion pathway protein N